jgi:hypothetical protein
MSNRTRNSFRWSCVRAKLGKVRSANFRGHQIWPLRCLKISESLNSQELAKQSVSLNGINVGNIIGEREVGDGRSDRKNVSLVVVAERWAKAGNARVTVSTVVIMH